MAPKLWAVFSVVLIANHAYGQGMFDLFGSGGMSTAGGLFDMGFGSATTPLDPAAKEARLTAAEEQMSEAMSETGRNSPERRRIETLIQLSGGKFSGDAAHLNYLVDEYMMTTPGPETTPKPKAARPAKKAAAQGKGGRRRGGGGGGGAGGSVRAGGRGRKGGRRGGRQQQGQNRRGNRQGRGQQQQQGRQGQQQPQDPWGQQSPNQRGPAAPRGNQWDQGPFDPWTSTMAAAAAAVQQPFNQWAQTTPSPWAAQQPTGNTGRGGRQNNQQTTDPWLHGGQQQQGQGQQRQWSGNNAWDQQQGPVQQTPAQIMDQWAHAQAQAAVQFTQAPQMQTQGSPNAQWSPAPQPTQDTFYQTTSIQEQRPKATFRKRKGSRSSPAAERLNRIQARIDAVQEQLLQAQSLPQGSNKMNELLSQMEGLLSVRSILTGTSGQAASMQTLQQNAGSSGPSANDWSSTWSPSSTHSNNAVPMQADPHFGGFPNDLQMPRNIHSTSTSALRSASPYQTFETTTWGVAPPSANVDSQIKQLSPFTDGSRFLGMGAETGGPRSVRSQILLNRKRKSSRFARNQSRAVKLSQSGFDRGATQFKQNMNILSVKEMDALQQASGEPNNATNGAPPAPPKEGEIRTLGKKTYVFRDMDGFDTFQWVISTPAPSTQTQAPGASQTTSPQTIGTSSSRQSRRVPRRRRRIRNGLRLNGAPIV